jgi:hypothetical protein
MTRRDKEWYARLTKRERSELYWLERAKNRRLGGASGMLPDGYRECSSCGQPGRGGLCNLCWDRLGALIAKGNGEEER